MDPEHNIEQYEGKGYFKQRSIAKASRLAIIVSIFAMLIAFVILIEFNLFWDRSTKMQKNSTAVVKQVQEQLSLMQDSIQVMQKQFEASEKHFKNMQTLIDQNQENLGKLLNQDRNHNEAWIFAEVNYLLNMASMNLSINQSPHNAIELLNIADNRIASVNDPALNALRNALSDDIATLKSIPQIKDHEILAQLSKLAMTIDTLKLKPSFKNQLHLPEKANAENTSKQSYWKKGLASTLKELKKMVIIRHEDDNPALMTPKQSFYLKENIRLLLQQAEWAVMHHQSSVYQSSLKQILIWLNQFYDKANPATKVFIGQLDTLLDQNISPKMPSLDASFNALKKAKHNYEKLPVEVSEETP